MEHLGTLRMCNLQLSAPVWMKPHTKEQIRYDLIYLHTFTWTKKHHCLLVHVKRRGSDWKRAQKKHLSIGPVLVLDLLEMVIQVSYCVSIQKHAQIEHILFSVCHLVKINTKKEYGRGDVTLGNAQDSNHHPPHTHTLYLIAQKSSWCCFSLAFSLEHSETHIIIRLRGNTACGSLTYTVLWF